LHSFVRYALPEMPLLATEKGGMIHAPPQPSPLQPNLHSSVLFPSTDAPARYKKRGNNRGGMRYGFGQDYVPGLLPALPPHRAIPNLPAKSGIEIHLRYACICVCGCMRSCGFGCVCLCVECVCCVCLSGVCACVCVDVLVCGVAVWL